MTVRKKIVVEEDDEPPARRLGDRWHVGKEIPLALIVAVVLQTVGVIWWVAQLSNKIDNAVSNMAEFKSERYTREDARRDRELLDQKLSAGASRDAELERRINQNEARVDRLERK